jgi:hypothetical protein
MKFLEKLFSAEQGSSLHGSIEQPEREAMIDLLLLGTYVDRHISLSESKAFDDAADALGWDSQTGPSIYISNATSRARDAHRSEATTAELIAFIARRLTSVGAKERALSLLNRLFMADGRTEKEAEFFKQVEAVFAD